MRRISTIAEQWWDYTTLDDDLLKDAARLTADDIAKLGRPGFEIRIFDTIEEFFCAEALEYINAWKQSTDDNPVGVCGPIGPTEQLPLVARMVNEMELPLRNAHFWGMDEWVVNGKTLDVDHPLSFAKADMDLCFHRIEKRFSMPESNIHFPSTDTIEQFSNSFDTVRCALIQGGQGEVKHWAFNDPVKREGKYRNEPPTPHDYLEKGTRVVDLHPLTIIQNARTSSAGIVSNIPNKAITIGPKETFKADMVSIWHPGWHDNPFGLRLTTLMISKKIADSTVPMSLLSLHNHVRFNFLRKGIGTCSVEMH
ncbi:MAG: hypothetical protein WC129_03870 [Sphaerochaetaceae bacterium]|jgi:glucosamine-6-phosphate deaminase|nr:hypothetical protein [Sphaerochaetaceae bacterium]